MGAWGNVVFSFCKINNQRNAASFIKVIYGTTNLLYYTEYIFEMEFSLLLAIFVLFPFYIAVKNVPTVNENVTRAKKN